MVAMTRASGQYSAGASALRWTILLSIGIYMLLPLFAMLEFSTRGIGGARSIAPWLAIGENDDLLDAIRVSLVLAVLTVVLMLVLLVPTMVWVQLRLPALLRVVEFICL